MFISPATATDAKSLGYVNTHKSFISQKFLYDFLERKDISN